MSISKAQQRATAKYVKNTYDRIEVKVPKGEKATIQAHAEQKGESINGFINRAIDETMERDKGGNSNAWDMQILQYCYQDDLPG